MSWLDVSHIGVQRGFAVAGAAFVLTLSLVAARPAPASAADLSDGPYLNGSPYEDPRFGDIYRHPAPPPPVVPYVEPYRPNYGEAPYQDDRGYLREMRPRVYSHSGGYGPGAQRGGCAPRDAIYAELARRGWSGAEETGERGRVFFTRARGGDGYWYDLTLDSCSGQLLETHPAPLHADAGPRRYRPSY